MIVMTPEQSCTKEISRFFKKYYSFCASSDSDDLKDLLSTLYSSFDKLEKAKGKLARNNRYSALKALRNFATHESELLNTSQAISINHHTIYGEIKTLCLIPIPTIEYVINNLRNKNIKKHINKYFIFYKNYVDIYPAIFNMAVDLYFLTKTYNLTIEGQDFHTLENTIAREKEYNISHYISGKLIMLDSTSIDDFIENNLIDMEDKNKELSSLTIDENGLYTHDTYFPIEILQSIPPSSLRAIMKELKDSNVIYETKESIQPNRPLSPIEEYAVHEYIRELKEKSL